ncbi:MAG: hypothetical protein QXS37_05825, partial [Candidatus Aenigmatarchaeota archaeon]
MKGLAFTIDMLIGLTLVIAIIPLLYSTQEPNHLETSYQVLNYQVKDLMNVLSKLKVSSFLNTPTI